MAQKWLPLHPTGPEKLPEPPQGKGTGPYLCKTPVAPMNLLRSVPAQMWAQNQGALIGLRGLGGGVRIQWQTLSPSLTLPGPILPLPKSNPSPPSPCPEKAHHWPALKLTSRTPSGIFSALRPSARLALASMPTVHTYTAGGKCLTALSRYSWLYHWRWAR